MTDLGASPPAPVPGPSQTVREFVGLYLAFAALCMLVYRGALAGPFISDDASMIVKNPYLAQPVAGLLAEAFAPAGEARHYAQGNYAPVMHLAHAFEVRLFGGSMRGYHMVNVLVHALNAVLLHALLVQAGLARAVCLAASALFLLHPANVESVAWISQLRSLLAMAGALAALLLLPRAPLASAAPFAAALLAKASASFALPMAAVFLYARHRRGEPTRRAALGLSLWVAALAIYTPIQMPMFASMARPPGDPYPDLWIHARSIAAIGARYLAMAATGYGVSAYQEPLPVQSNLDPWWLAGLAAALCFGARIAVTLRRARPEAGWWLGAAAAFAPISQWLPFLFGMGDRYLYFILPGLIGGSCLAGSELHERAASLLRRSGRAALLPWLSRGALALAALWAALFALHARERAPLWQAEGLLLQDAASQYPDGAVAHYVRAVLALERRDPDTALVELRASADRGGGLSHPFYGDPWLAPLYTDPRFQQLIRDIAQMEIDGARGQEPTSQRQVYILASAYYMRGDLDEAVATLEQALRMGGPLDDEVLRLLERARQERAGRAPRGPFSSPPPTGSKPIFDFPSGRPLGPDEWPEP